jgi:hypothetical protein
MKKMMQLFKTLHQNILGIIKRKNLASREPRFEDFLNYLFDFNHFNF